MSLHCIIAACPKCKNEHKIARGIATAERIHLICHVCENAFFVDVTDQDLRLADMRALAR